MVQISGFFDQGGLSLRRSDEGEALTIHEKIDCEAPAEQVLKDIRRQIHRHFWPRTKSASFWKACAAGTTSRVVPQERDRQAAIYYILVKGNLSRLASVAWQATTARAAATGEVEDLRCETRVPTECVSSGARTRVT